MATTTNFGWETPDDTDLVKDGAAAIRTALGGVDTSFVDLKGGTTGQILAKASSADLDFVWSSDATGMTNPMTTTGDTIYSSSGSTPARLGIGSTGQVLTVSGGLPAWATPGSATVGFTLLSTTGLSGATTTISGISGQQTLHLLISGATSATASASMNLGFNSDTSGNYGFTANYAIAASSYSPNNFISNANPGDTEIPFGRGSTGGTYMDGNITIFGAKSTSAKVFTYAAGGAANGGNGHRTFSGGGFYKGTSAITSINIKCSGGTFNGGTAYLYGSSN